MKKFTSIALTMILGASGFTAVAQDLGTGTAVVQTNIGSPMMPNYRNDIAPEYVSALPNVLFVWGDNINNPTAIELVDPKQSPTMIPGMPNVYAPVDLYTPGATAPLQINATLNTTKTSLSVNLLSAAMAGYGEYTVIIPENTVKDASGNTNAETEYKVTYCKSATATLTPSEYQLAPTDFTGVTINLAGTLDKYLVAEDVNIIKLINYNTLLIDKAWTSNDITVSDDKKTLSVSFDGLTFANNEKYRIQVDAGTFTVLEGETLCLYNGNTVDYFLWDGLDEAQIIEKPDMYSSPNVSPIVMTWNYQNIHAVGDEIDVKVTYFDKNTYEDVDIALDPSAVQLINIPNPADETSTLAEGSYNALKIELASAVADKYTNFTVVVPQGVIANDEDKVNLETEVMFTVYPLTDCEVIFEEESEDDPGVYYLGWTVQSNISEISANYNGPTEMSLLDSEGNEIVSIPSFYSTYSTPSYWLSGYGMMSGRNTEVYVDLDIANLKDGKYTLVVPEAMFMIYTNDENLTVYLTAKEEIEVIIGEVSEDQPSGIDKTFNNESVDGYVVYDLQGVKVFESKEAGAINSLSNGLYIINGKKVLIRK